MPVKIKNRTFLLFSFYKYLGFLGYLSVPAVIHINEVLKKFIYLNTIVRLRAFIKNKFSFKNDFSNFLM